MTKTNWLCRNVIKGPMFALCVNADEWEAAHDELELPEEGRPEFPEQGIAATSTSITKQGLSCIVALNLMDEDHATPHALGLLAHEATHIFQDFAEDIGEEKPSAEFMAYSIQHFTSELINSYQQKLESMQ